MSDQGRPSRRMNQDDRYDLAMAGEAVSRRNRPSQLVVAAGLVFVAASAVLGFSSCKRASAGKDLRSEAAQLRTLAGLLAELDATDRAVDPEAEAFYEPYPGVLTKMEELAEEAGFTKKLVFPKTETDQNYPGVIGKRYPYNGLEEADLGVLLAFVESATEQIPGMRIDSIAISPTPRAWKMDVSFKRWERAQSP